MIQVVLIDIDNTLLSFSGYVKEAMRDGFAQYGLKPYTEAMFPVFERINNSLWEQIEQGTLSFEELTEIRWNLIFHALGISFDGRIFEQYFREKLFFSAVPEPGAVELLEYLSRRYRLCIASNGPYEQQINRLRLGNMIKTENPAVSRLKRSRCRSSQVITDSPTPFSASFCHFRRINNGQIYSPLPYPRTSSINDPFRRLFS